MNKTYTEAACKVLTFHYFQVLFCAEGEFQMTPRE